MVMLLPAMPEYSGRGDRIPQMQTYEGRPRIHAPAHTIMRPTTMAMHAGRLAQKACLVRVGVLDAAVQLVFAAGIESTLGAACAGRAGHLHNRSSGTGAEAAG